MSKLKAVLATAAALVIGGTAIGIALNQAGQTHSMGAKEWCKRIEAISEDSKRKTFFIAIPQWRLAAGLPKAWPDTVDGRMLGDCGGGGCSFAPGVAEHCVYEYAYKSSPQVNGYRLFEVNAHPYIAKGWKLWAESTNGDGFGDRVYWWQSFAGPLKGCINNANMSNAQCLNILELDSRCLILPNGDLCRLGNVMGTGAACPYASILATPDQAFLFPCTSYNGPTWWEYAAKREWDDEEFDELW